MPVYQNAEVLYTCLQATFDRIQDESPEAITDLIIARLALRFKCSQPVAEILLSGRQATFQAEYGPSALRPDLDITLTGDTLHQILNDSLSMKKALGSGLLKVRGPAWKLKPLAGLIQAGRLYYPETARTYNVI